MSLMTTASGAPMFRHTHPLSTCLPEPLQPNSPTSCWGPPKACSSTSPSSAGPPSQVLSQKPRVVRPLSVHIHPVSTPSRVRLCLQIHPGAWNPRGALCCSPNGLRAFAHAVPDASAWLGKGSGAGPWHSHCIAGGSPKRIDTGPRSRSFCWRHLTSHVLLIRDRRSHSQQHCSSLPNKHLFSQEAPHRLPERRTPQNATVLRGRSEHQNHQQKCKNAKTGCLGSLAC